MKKILLIIGLSLSLFAAETALEMNKNVNRASLLKYFPQYQGNKHKTSFIYEMYDLGQKNPYEIQRWLDSYYEVAITRLLRINVLTVKEYDGWLDLDIVENKEIKKCKDLGLTPFTLKKKYPNKSCEQVRRILQ
ncbi:hypothetical protein [Sulfurimonas microaerophilic]|uniref:hypothetical protein n=1 Tax=Sulfurimonas microaerophilic TaxID=3058392 RepID=UPI002714A785|nr:hypothetical protein [Sulfurimonas sp. hsl 1-7]